MAATALYGLVYQPAGFALVPDVIARLAARDRKLLQGSASGEEETSGLDITTGQF